MTTLFKVVRLMKTELELTASNTTLTPQPQNGLLK